MKIHGRRRLTQKQAQILICSRHKMWSISNSENNAYFMQQNGTFMEKMLRHCSCKQSRIYQGKYTFLYTILKLYKLRFVVLNKTHLKLRQYMLQVHVIL